MIVIWIVYGLITGLIARALYPGKDKIGFLPTIGLGIAGSYVGGLIQWFLGHGHSPLQPSGIVFGIIGGVIFLAVYRWMMLKSEHRNFWTGKKYL
jgi:uncharacterized membrane protein YeaQ/YmgE (transglycosylase-associated protein family)